jgi:hypothetical protein
MSKQTKEQESRTKEQESKATKEVNNGHRGALVLRPRPRRLRRGARLAQRGEPRVQSLTLRYLFRRNLGDVTMELIERTAGERRGGDSRE